MWSCTGCGVTSSQLRSVRRSEGTAVVEEEFERAYTCSQLLCGCDVDRLAMPSNKKTRPEVQSWSGICTRTNSAPRAWSELHKHVSHASCIKCGKHTQHKPDQILQTAQGFKAPRKVHQVQITCVQSPAGALPCTSCTHVPHHRSHVHFRHHRQAP